MLYLGYYTKIFSFLYKLRYTRNIKCIVKMLQNPSVKLVHIMYTDSSSYYLCPCTSDCILWSCSALLHAIRSWEDCYKPQVSKWGRYFVLHWTWYVVHDVALSCWLLCHTGRMFSTAHWSCSTYKGTHYIYLLHSLHRVV